MTVLPVRCTMRVVRVLAYGSATPILAPGSELQMEIPDGALLHDGVRAADGVLVAADLEMSILAIDRAMNAAPQAVWRLISARLLP